MNDLAPGDAIRLDDIPAEVIKTYSVGDLEYLRAYVEDVGVKTVCIDDVGIERTPDQLDALDPATATHTDYRKSLPVVRRNGSANHRETVTINSISCIPSTSGRVKLEDEADEFRVLMTEFDRLNGCIEWIDLSFVKRKRTPEWAMQVGIRCHLAGISTRDTSQFL